MSAPAAAAGGVAAARRSASLGRAGLVIGVASIALLGLLIFGNAPASLSDTISSKSSRLVSLATLSGKIRDSIRYPPGRTGDDDPNDDDAAAAPSAVKSDTQKAVAGSGGSRAAATSPEPAPLGEDGLPLFTGTRPLEKMGELPSPAPVGAPGLATGISKLLPSQFASRKYFLPLMIVEGFGAWSDAIWETMHLAKALDRVWVEPCVRNGCIEPCRCGAIRDVEPWSPEAEAAAAAAGRDPGLLPYIPVGCKLDLGRREVPNEDFKAESYPLSAYVDVDAMAQRFAPGHVVRYSDWCAAYNSSANARVADADGLVPTHPTFKKWIEPRAYNYDLSPHHLTDVINTSVVVGDFFFEQLRIGHLPSREEGMQVLRSDSHQHIFVYHYFRSMFSLYFQFPAVPIARWHVAAVNRFVSEQLNGKPTVAFHWRSEQVDTRLIEPCAVEVAGIATAALPGLLSPDHSHVVLVSDMPAPSNPNRMWNDYANGDDAPRHRAMATMLAAGFRKYDAHIINATGGMLLDAGVLSLRDFLLSATADWYVTCQGDHWGDCHGCFRSGSNIVGRITRERERKGLPSSTAWFKITAENAPESLGIDPKNPHRKQHDFKEPATTAGVQH